jgi:hypothetical protein
LSEWILQRPRHYQRHRLGVMSIRPWMTTTTDGKLYYMYIIFNIEMKVVRKGCWKLFSSYPWTANETDGVRVWLVDGLLK